MPDLSVLIAVAERRTPLVLGIIAAVFLNALVTE